jgi:hypothetical protein
MQRNPDQTLRPPLIREDAKAAQQTDGAEHSDR